MADHDDREQDGAAAGAAQIRASDRRAILYVAEMHKWAINDYPEYTELLRRLDFIYVTFSARGDLVTSSARYGRIIGFPSLDIVLEYLRRPSW